MSSWNLQPGAWLAHAEATHVEEPKVCECGHAEEQHADPDYNCVGDPPYYVACPRPCLVEGCDCGSYFEP